MNRDLATGVFGLSVLLRLSFAASPGMPAIGRVSAAPTAPASPPTRTCRSSGRPTNILWKTAIPGIGHSSPIVCTAAASSCNRRPRTARNAGCSASTPPRATSSGKRRPPAQKAKKHPLNSLASSTPATDGERVYAVFWDGKDIHLGAYDFKDGKPIWEKNLGGFKSQHGVGHSPMVIDGKVILANDQDGSAHLLAFDARSGDKVWEAERQGVPLLLLNADRPCPGRTASKELIVASTAGITAYNPADGKPNWWYTWSFRGMPLRTVASPILAEWSGHRQQRRRLRGRARSSPSSSATRATSPPTTWSGRTARNTVPYVPCLLAHGEHLQRHTIKAWPSAMWPARARKCGASV